LGAATGVEVAGVIATVVVVEVAATVVVAVSAAAIVVVVFAGALVVVAGTAVVVVDVDAGASVVVTLVVWLTKDVASVTTSLPPQATNTIIAATATTKALDVPTELSLTFSYRCCLSLNIANKTR